MYSLCDSHKVVASVSLSSMATSPNFTVPKAAKIVPHIGAFSPNLATLEGRGHGPFFLKTPLSGENVPGLNTGPGAAVAFPTCRYPGSPHYETLTGRSHVSKIVVSILSPFLIPPLLLSSLTPSVLFFLFLLPFFIFLGSSMPWNHAVMGSGGELPVCPSRSRPPNDLGTYWCENRPLIWEWWQRCWRGLQTRTSITSHNK